MRVCHRRSDAKNSVLHASTDAGRIPTTPEEQLLGELPVSSARFDHIDPGTMSELTADRDAKDTVLERDLDLGGVDARYVELDDQLVACLVDVVGEHRGCLGTGSNGKLAEIIEPDRTIVVQGVDSIHQGLLPNVCTPIVNSFSY